MPWRSILASEAVGIDEILLLLKLNTECRNPFLRAGSSSSRFGGTQQSFKPSSLARSKAAPEWPRTPINIQYSMSMGP